MYPSDGHLPEEDPRTIVTEHAFRVAPELLGLPLARPWRRAWALSIDGLLIALLANAPDVVFGIAVAFVILRAVRRPATGGFVRRSARRWMQFTAAIILFAVSTSLWNSFEEVVGGDRGAEADRGGQITLAGMPAFFAGADALAVMNATDETAARGALEQMTDALRQSGMPDEDVAEMLTELPAAVPNRPWLAPAADSVLARMREAATPVAATDAAERETAFLEYAAALQAGDEVATDRLRPGVAAAFSADTVAALQAQIERRDERVSSLTTALEEARESSILDRFRSLLDDLGLGFGWTSLYFTAFLVLWRGRTPGKRLFGLRVVRLDNRPLGWWNAFERFAGYAAGLATGLLGFLQIFWDSNRQAIQDKISRTVVVQD